MLAHAVLHVVPQLVEKLDTRRSNFKCAFAPSSFRPPTSDKSLSAHISTAAFSLKCLMQHRCLHHGSRALLDGSAARRGWRPAFMKNTRFLKNVGVNTYTMRKSQWWSTSWEKCPRPALPRCGRRWWKTTRSKCVKALKMLLLQRRALSHALCATLVVVVSLSSFGFRL